MAQYGPLNILLLIFLNICMHASHKPTDSENAEEQGPEKTLDSPAEQRDDSPERV